jgi:hypothetical protein
MSGEDPRLRVLFPFPHKCSEIHNDQRTATTEILQTKENVERVVRATERRRLPRVRVEFNRAASGG